VRYVNGTATCEVRLGEDWRVTPDDSLVASLSEWLKPENVEFVYA
jgi:DNA polymerase-3 subunit alpha